MNSLDKQVKDGPSLTEVLENAGIFYEAQYKEVKVVANVSLQEHTNTPHTPRLAWPLGGGQVCRGSSSSVRLARKADPNSRPSCAAGVGVVVCLLWRTRDVALFLRVADSGGSVPRLALVSLPAVARGGRPGVLLTLLCFPPPGLQDLRQQSEQSQEETGSAEGHPP